MVTFVSIVPGLKNISDTRKVFAMKIPRSATDEVKLLYSEKVHELAWTSLASPTTKIWEF